MYRVTYQEDRNSEVYECENIQLVAVLIFDLVNRKGYNESLFKIEFVARG